ncbi:uncharacterized protein LOC113271853 [Papaver somniferum]|uniref:uncharacterized protein LOC113271853 n=1 Tax=Papaver somniferum TaxID=3469 RepID=UPI000E70399B|nr:uncharacterized protein LOC113271853 [Papaver somniferum]
MNLMVKLAWRLCTEPDQLWFRILQPKYAAYCDFLHLQEDNTNSSWIWKGIEQGLKIVQQHYRCTIKCGTKALVWYDRWVNGLTEPPTPKHNFADPARIVYVSDLMLNNPTRWNVPLTTELFDSQIVQLILNMYIPQHGEDALIW